VTFSDPPVQFSKMEIDQILAEAQNQAALFAALNREVGKSKEFLSKVRASLVLSLGLLNFDRLIQATKNKDEWGGPPEEEIYAGGNVGAWMEEA
jgi:hypothetical protein